ncbi:hypothetical protein, partial [Vibrio cholerae]|uniref:hypothetical protein n=1 Tax=Vibrio cholerae TaxID=666 RepID=UPI00301DD118
KQLAHSMFFLYSQTSMEETHNTTLIRVLCLLRNPKKDDSARQYEKLFNQRWKLELYFSILIQ